MSKAGNWFLVEMIPCLVIAEGLYWFVGGSSDAATPVRNTAVVVQILAAAALLVLAEILRSRPGRSVASRSPREAGRDAIRQGALMREARP